MCCWIKKEKNVAQEDLLDGIQCQSQWFLLRTTTTTFSFLFLQSCKYDRLSTNLAQNIADNCTLPVVQGAVALHCLLLSRRTIASLSIGQFASRELYITKKINMHKFLCRDPSNDSSLPREWCGCSLLLAS